MTVKTAFPPLLSPRALVTRVPGWTWPLVISGVIYVAVTLAILSAYPDTEVRLRFTLDPILSASLAIQVHIVAAISCFMIGLVLLLAPKGFGFHKTFGWAWVAAMAVTALSSFFITGLMGSSYSPIHALSAWTLIGLPFGIAAIKRRDVKKHRESMTGMFIGGMAIAGLFTFLPGRTMWNVFFALG